MCPPPCGPRRRCSSRSSKPAIKTRISKAEVEEIIASGDYECTYKMSYSSGFNPYEGCTNNLMMILHDGETTVKVAGRRNALYLEGYRTVIMDAPCFPATILFRSEIED